MALVDDLIAAVTVEDVLREMRLENISEIDVSQEMVDQEIETAAYIVADYADNGSSASFEQMVIATRVEAAMNLLDTDLTTWIESYEELDLSADIDLERRLDQLYNKRDRVFQMIRPEETPALYSLGER